MSGLTSRSHGSPSTIGVDGGSRGEGVVVVLRDSCRGGAPIEELELEGFVEVVASEVELVADEDTGGAAVYEGGKFLERAAKSDIDDERSRRPRAKLRRGPGLVDCGLGALVGGWDMEGYQSGIGGVVPVEA
ncbi:hypothetical protein C0989_010577 [Termitomyces sp. Mn162]|nr:hypothetical protein C0989_010098 [Termitomyces sp. Mn162]KAG5348417.1 hypothetical protein C0989_010577 [Termitomyces sp. Mn162]